MTNPIVAQVEDFDHEHLNEYETQRSREKASDLLKSDLPPRYLEAVCGHLSAQEWVRENIRSAVAGGHPVPSIARGESLVVSGEVGTGKTWLAYGIMRAFAASGLRCRWTAATAADYYAALRPRHGVDHEAEYQRHATAPLLLLDDLGAEKPSEWTLEQMYRLVNHRYNHMLPTVFTTNLVGGTGPGSIRSTLGDRIASRLGQMCRRVVLEGPDLRRSARPHLTPVGDSR